MVGVSRISKKAQFPSIILDSTKYSAMFYVNANEAGTSAMEILAMSGRNVALMLNDYVETHFEFELPWYSMIIFVIVFQYYVHCQRATQWW